jgi:hypothetical protein
MHQPENTRLWGYREAPIQNAHPSRGEWPQPMGLFNPFCGHFGSGVGG